jgi:hypothetical protein
VGRCVMQTGIDVEDPNDREPEELPKWLAAGFNPEVAEVWRRWRFSIARAQAWVAAGVDEGLHAAQWSTAGVAPDTVEEWRAAGIEASEAVRWHEFGYGLEGARFERQKGHGPDQAFAQTHPNPTVGLSTRIRQTGLAGGRFAGSMRGLHEAGVDPRIIHSYAQHQWMDESALPWARQGIDANDAYMWHELGLTPAEAGRLELLGRTVGDVVREWWAAGIPLEEFADWVGAGLSAAEAVEQRARGITAEHAASLRALRRDEAPDPASSAQQRPPHRRRGAPRREQSGPPPADETAARTAISQAYADMGEIDEDSGTVPSVEGSAGLAVCRQQATEIARARFGGQVPDVTVVFTVDVVRFVNDREAVVTYTADITGSLNITLRDRPGRSILVDGQWKVTRETFCEWLRVGGVECPPRQEP